MIVTITMALKTLYQLLLANDPARLRVLARQWDVSLMASQKVDMAAELVAGMATDGAVGEILEQLTPEQRDALDDLLRKGGSVPWTVFVRRWGEVRAVGAGRLEREELWHDPQSEAEALWFLGLVHRAFTENIEHPVEMAFVPEELMLYMPPPRVVSIPAPEEIADPPYSSSHSDTLADDLVTLWAALQQGDTAKDIQLSTLHPPAEVRRTLLETLSLEQKWLRSRDRSLHPDAILKWLKSGMWTQATSLFEAWRTSREWRDVAQIPTLRPDPVKGWPAAPPNSRCAFLEILARCRLGAWYSVAAFTSYVKAHATDFLRPDGDYEVWAPRSTLTEAPLRGFDVWDAVEGALVAYLITGPLYWLGAVSIGGAEPDASDAFALTEMGAAWLGTAAPPQLPIAPPIVIESDGQVSVPYAHRYERFQLSRIANLDRSPARCTDTDAPAGARVYAYRISPASLNRAKEQRISCDRVISFLQEAAGVPELPDQLKTAIQRGYQQEHGGSLTRRWLLRVSEPRHLTLPGVAELLQERLTPEWAVVADGNSDQIIALFAEHGIWLEIEEA
jgi:hypothetical protein